jgi:uracil-DNA glycosylase
MERKEGTIQLLHEIRGVLAGHQTSSIATYPASSELLSFFDSCSRQPSTPASFKVPHQARKSTLVQEAAPIIKKSDHAGLAEITAEVTQCRSCPLGGQRSIAVAGKGGGKKIRLLIIGHWLPVAAWGNTQAVFGLEEDQMLARMLAAIHLSMEEVFVTNVIKCGVGLDIQPQAEHIDACSSYLQRQIAAVAPELICTMGMVATKTLLRLSQPLSRLRGRFYNYKGADGMEIPLLPTYHPGYLLQNPEMKNATWQDLQALQKRLE